MPGPLFTFASYLGMASGGVQQVLAGMLGGESLAEAGPARRLAVAGALGDYLAVDALEKHLDEVGVLEPLHHGAEGRKMRLSKALTVAGGCFWCLDGVYRDLKGVARGSDTETYAALKLEVATRRWAGVPFYLRTGKRLAARHAQIVVNFREVPHPIFPGSARANKLVIKLQPEDGLELHMLAARGSASAAAAEVEHALDAPLDPRAPAYWGEGTVAADDPALPKLIASPPSSAHHCGIQVRRRRVLISSARPLAAIARIAPRNSSSSGRSSSRTCRQLMQQNVQKSRRTTLPRRSSRATCSPPVFSQPRPTSSDARTRVAARGTAAGASAVGAGFGVCGAVMSTIMTHAPDASAVSGRRRRHRGKDDAAGRVRLSRRPGRRPASPRR